MPTVKLTQSFDITEKRNLGKEIVNQRLQVEVMYDSEDDSFEVENVFISQDDMKLEVSKLLHKADGNPLNTILENIDWLEIYRQDRQQRTYEKSLFNLAGNIARNDAMNRLNISL